MRSDSLLIRRRFRGGLRRGDSLAFCWTASRLSYFYYFFPGVLSVVTPAPGVLGTADSLEFHERASPQHLRRLHFHPQQQGRYHHVHDEQEWWIVSTPRRSCKLQKKIESEMDAAFVWSFLVGRASPPGFDFLSCHGTAIGACFTVNELFKQVGVNFFSLFGSLRVPPVVLVCCFCI